MYVGMMLNVIQLHVTDTQYGPGPCHYKTLAKVM